MEQHEYSHHRLKTTRENYFLLPLLAILSIALTHRFPYQTCDNVLRTFHASHMPWRGFHNIIMLSAIP